MTEDDIRDYIRVEMSQHCACGGMATDSQSRPSVRSRPATEHQLARKVGDGPELRVVVNTNDPDYEHIYSIEAYDEPAENTPLLAAHTNQSGGETERLILESKKVQPVQPNKSARAVLVKAAKPVVRKAGKVTAPRGYPVRAVAPKSVRPKRGVAGEAPAPAPAEVCLLPMDEGGCSRYSLRWYFHSEVRACRPFIYSGCEGNGNRFLHLEQCQEQCLGQA